MLNLKTAIIGVALVIASAVGLTIATPSSASAACGEFLGFPAWYDGLVDANCKIHEPEAAFPTKTDEEALTYYIWRIVLNALEIALRVIGIVAVAFMIYGGFQYLTSSGSPERAAGAMKTIVNASVGLIIALGVTALQGLIWKVVAGSTNDYGVYDGTAANVLKEAFNLVYYIAGAIAVIMIIVGGLNYVTSSGDPGRMTKAKNTLLYAVIGLVVIIAAWAITNFIANRF